MPIRWSFTFLLVFEITVLDVLNVDLFLYQRRPMYIVSVLVFSTCLPYIRCTGKMLVSKGCNVAIVHGTAAYRSLVCFAVFNISTRHQPSYGDCLEVKREYYQNCRVLDCVTQCSQSAAHLYEQFLQVHQIGFVTLGPLRCA